MIASDGRGRWKASFPAVNKADAPSVDTTNPTAAYRRLNSQRNKHATTSSTITSAGDPKLAIHANGAMAAGERKAATSCAAA